MRPMFLDFPQEESLFANAQQFMFGDDILVLPKISTENLWVTLPTSNDWYYLNSKLVETRKGTFAWTFNELEMPVWIKGGTILPILLHDGALSLLRAINNNISLQIYPSATGDARGQVVIDDGWSTNPETSRVSFSFNNNDLFVLSTDNSYITNKTI